MKLIYFGLFLTIFTNATTLLVALSSLARHKRPLPRVLFFGLIFSVSAGPALLTLRQAHILHFGPTWLLELGFPWTLMIGSFLFLYTRSLTDVDFVIQKKDWLHFFPFLFGCIWLLAWGRLPVETFEFGGPMSVEKYLRVTMAVAVGSVYCVAAYRHVSRYRESLKNIVSSTEGLTLNWLNYLFVLSTVFLGLGFLEVLTGWNFSVTPLFAPAACMFLLCISFFGLTESSVFKLEGVNRELLQKQSSPRHVDGVLLDQSRRKLLDYFDKNKPYLSAGLKVSDLAEPLSLKPYEVSEVINKAFGVTFFDLVNSYRVKEVKQKLSQSKTDSDKILTIAFDSGFNTKSSFNSAFKKHTGLTPSAYREKRQ